MSNTSTAVDTSIGSTIGFFIDNIIGSKEDGKYIPNQLSKYGKIKITKSFYLTKEQHNDAYSIALNAEETENDGEEIIMIDDNEYPWVMELHKIAVAYFEANFD